MEGTIAYTQGFLSGLGVIFGFCLASNVTIYIEAIKEPCKSQDIDCHKKLSRISFFLSVTSVLTAIMLGIFQYSLLQGDFFTVAQGIEKKYFSCQIVYIITMFLVVLFNFIISFSICRRKKNECINNEVSDKDSNGNADELDQEEKSKCERSVVAEVS